MLEVVVTNKRQESDRIVSFELCRSDGGPLPAFSAGSHIDVYLDEHLIRQYSLWNSSEDTARYRIGVLLEDASRGGSSTMHQRVKCGDKLKISEPRNHFPLVHEAKKTILFAGGIGVTPILCMADRLARIGAEFEMHYCARSLERMAFLDHVRSAPYSNSVHIHLDDGPDAQKLNVSNILSARAEGTHIYVCGPGGFMAYVLDTAAKLGWPANQVHREYFSATAPATQDSDQSFEVRLASSGRSIVIPPGEPVTKVLEACGIEIPTSCESGVCGTCLTRVLQGVPDHRDSILSDEEKAANDLFTPCCSRSKTPVLVLDL